VFKGLMFYRLQLSTLWGWTSHRRQHERSSYAHDSVVYWTGIFCGKKFHLLYWQYWRIFHV